MSTFIDVSSETIHKLNVNTLKMCVFLVDNSDLRRCAFRENSSLPHWKDAKYIHDDQTMFGKFSES